MYSLVGLLSLTTYTLLYISVGVATDVRRQHDTDTDDRNTTVKTQVSSYRYAVTRGPTRAKCVAIVVMQETRGGHAHTTQHLVHLARD